MPAKKPSKRSSPKQSTLDKAVAKGAGFVTRLNSATKTPWASAPSLSSPARRTWYAAVRVRQDVDGSVSDIRLADLDRKAPPRVVTVALLGVAPDGTIRGLTGAEMKRSFDRLLQEAVRRHGLVPAGSDFVRAVFRHKER